MGSSSVRGNVRSFASTEYIQSLGSGVFQRCVSEIVSPYNYMGRLKISHLSTFRQSIIAKISPFFCPIEPGLFLLKDTIFPFDGEDTYFNNKITHNAMIDIFNLIIADIDAPPRKKLRSTSDADTLA